MSYKLRKPYTEKQRMNFIVQYNHNQGLEIAEGEEYLYALLPNEVLVDGVAVINPDYEAEQELKEKERIARLSCTKRDFALMLQEMGVDYFTQLKPLIDSNEQAKLEWELCERLYRFNPMIDLMAGHLGVTPEMLDGLFQYANGEITAKEFEALIPKEEENEDTTFIQKDTEATA